MILDCTGYLSHNVPPVILVIMVRVLPVVLAPLLIIVLEVQLVLLNYHVIQVQLLLLDLHPLTTQCTTCTAGYYWTGTANSCAACTSPYYCLGGFQSGESSCNTGSGTAGERGDTSTAACIICSAGYYWTGTANSCAACTSPSYCPGGNQVVASSCTGGSATSIAQATSLAQCTSCNSGYYGTGPGCTQCSDGSYCPGGPAGSTQISCGPGSTSTCSGTGTCTSQASCTTCAGGYYGKPGGMYCL